MGIIVLKSNLHFCFNLEKRDLQPEVMDQPSISNDDLNFALSDLAKVHKLSFTAQQIWKQVKQWCIKNKVKEVRILDIACGGGDILIKLCELAQRDNIKIIGLGADINQKSCDRANSLALSKNLHQTVQFKVQDIFLKETYDNYDIAICSLFLHHLKTEDIICLLKQIVASEVKLFICNDLKRSVLGYYMALIGTRLFTTSPIVHIDSLISVKAALSIKEISSYCMQAGMTSAKICSYWPERFNINWERACE